MVGFLFGVGCEGKIPVESGVTVAFWLTEMMDDRPTFLLLGRLWLKGFLGA